MIEYIKILEEYFQSNDMKATLQTFRAELLSKIPNKPSQQFMSLLQEKHQIVYEQQKQKLNPEKRMLKKKKQQLPVQGLLGKIAYSSKLLEDHSLNQKINHLMDNKIFINCLNKMFPETKKLIKNSEHRYQDQLQMVQGPSNLINKSGTESQFIDIEHNQLSDIQANFEENQNSILSQPSQVLNQLRKVQATDEYSDDRDLGYHQYVFEENQLMDGCNTITKKYNYPLCAIRKDLNNHKNNNNNSKQKKQGLKKFPQKMIFPCEQDSIYPIQYNGVSFDLMKIKVIYDRQKIGYQANQQLVYKKGDTIAGRYEVQKILGSGVFANVIKAKDIHSDKQEVTCFKMIQNNKDFFDQALDEIKILQYIKSNCDPDKQFLIDFKQAFYHRQHLFIETCLLKDNLLTAFQSNPTFFSIPVIRMISKQILIGLSTLHQLSIIHADLKPQNIMIKTYNPIQIRIIDLGNGCFIHDQNLGQYVQSRSYRAPEVVLGCGYNQKIDIWSLGCIVAQLWTKNVLFYNTQIQGMIARTQSILGPWPQSMLESGSNVSNFFSKQNLIYYEYESRYHILVPKKTSLKHRIRCDDQLFIDFIRTLLQIDPQKRVSADQALKHPFLNI